MPEVLFNGTAGRIQGKIRTHPQENSPIALLLPPHPQHGGTMDNKILLAMYKVFSNLGFTVLRINYRGVGKSTGAWGVADGELNDAAMSLDWLQNQYPTARRFWIGGFSFGAWIGMQLLMRRPELESFVAVAPPAHMFDFSFLTPCPVPGLIVHGTDDQVVPVSAVDGLMAKMRMQKGIDVEYKKIEGADHFFDHHIPQLTSSIHQYVTDKIRTQSVVASI